MQAWEPQHPGPPAALVTRRPEGGRAGPLAYLPGEVIARLLATVHLAPSAHHQPRCHPEGRLKCLWGRRKQDMSSSYMHSWPGFEGAAEPHPSMPDPIILAPNLHQRDRGKGVTSRVTIPILCGQDAVLQGVPGPRELFWGCLP